MRRLRWTGSALCVLVPLILLGGHRPLSAAEHVRVGVVRSLGGAPVFVARGKGYFAAEGLDPEVVLFDSAQPIALAVASGDLDFGTTGMTAAFFALAAQGTLKLLGATGEGHAGFGGVSILASNRAYAAGLQSLKDLGGHSIAITQLGTPLHYILGRVLEKYGIDLNSVRVLPLQSNSNVQSALKGGQADAGVQSTGAYPLLERGEAHLLGVASNELPPGGQIDAAFTTAKTANERPQVVEHFVAAIRRAQRAWDEAFADGAGHRADQATAPEMLAIASQALNEPAETLKLGMVYFDPQARISEANLRRMFDWYKAHNLLKADIDPATLIDRRYALLMP